MPEIILWHRSWGDSIWPVCVAPRSLTKANSLLSRRVHERQAVFKDLQRPVSTLWVFVFPCPVKLFRHSRDQKSPGMTKLNVAIFLFPFPSADLPDGDLRGKTKTKTKSKQKLFHFALPLNVVTYDKWLEIVITNIIPLLALEEHGVLFVFQKHL